MYKVQDILSSKEGQYVSRKMLAAMSSPAVLSKLNQEDRQLYVAGLKGFKNLVNRYALATEAEAKEGKIKIPMSVIILLGVVTTGVSLAFIIRLCRYLASEFNVGALALFIIFLFIMLLLAVLYLLAQKALADVVLRVFENERARALFMSTLDSISAMTFTVVCMMLATKLVAKTSLAEVWKKVKVFFKSKLNRVLFVGPYVIRVLYATISKLDVHIIYGMIKLGR